MFVVWALIFCIVATVACLGCGWVMEAMADESMRAEAARWRRSALAYLLVLNALTAVLHFCKRFGGEVEPLVPNYLSAIFSGCLLIYPLWITWKFWNRKRNISTFNQQEADTR